MCCAAQRRAAVYAEAGGAAQQRELGRPLAAAARVTAPWGLSLTPRGVWTPAPPRAPRCRCHRRPPAVSAVCRLLCALCAARCVHLRKQLCSARVLFVAVVPARRWSPAARSWLLSRVQLHRPPSQILRPLKPQLMNRPPAAQQRCCELATLLRGCVNTCTAVRARHPRAATGGGRMCKAEGETSPHFRHLFTCDWAN